MSSTEESSALEGAAVKPRRRLKKRVITRSSSGESSTDSPLLRRKDKSIRHIREDVVRKKSRSSASDENGSPKKMKMQHTRSSSFVFDHPLVHHARESSYAMYQQSMDIARNTISELDLPASSWCGFFACSMLIVTLGEVVKVNNTQKTPYMDEVFHVKQAQHYCVGNWSVWDNKITTLPGLYILTALIARIAGFLSSHPILHWCSIEKLRFVNLLMSVFVFLVMYTIFRKLSRRLKDEPGLGIKPIHRTCCMMNSLVVCCFPLLYFYNLLYYTDVGSTLFVLACYSCSIRNHHFKGALFGAISVLFRQTNIIWVGFTAGTVVIRDLEMMGHFTVKSNFISQFKISLDIILFKNFKRYIKLLVPYIIVIVGFIVFVIINQGIVVGDRNAHKPVLHFAQFFYFLLFVTAFSLPHMVQRLRYSHLTVFNYIFKPVHIMLFFVSAVVSVYFFRYEHPYLLADNRHYTFYIWRKILYRTEYTMYFLLPVCFYTFLNMTALLATVHSKFFCLLYFVCCLVQIVPQQLLEFRYFLIPYLLYRLNVPQHSWVVLFLELCQYTLINLVTVKIFLNKPFMWDTADVMNPNPQRFMW